MPMPGGALCNPADQNPSIFGKYQFFVNYPYALPTFTTGLFGASAAIVAAIFIKEVSCSPPSCNTSVIKY